MNVPATHAIHTTAPLTLADKGLLAHLRISRWNAYAFDERATRDVNAANATADAGRFNKKLMTNCQALKEANSACNAVYAYHVAHTLPWFDDGPRILPATSYFEYQAAVMSLVNAANVAADRLPLVWANDVMEDSKRLGPLYNAADYPADIRARFSVRLDIMPVPNAGDFRVAVSAEDKARMEELEQEVTANATKYLTKELATPLRALLTRLTEYTGEGKQRWHRSIVDNVLDVVNRLPAMNIADDDRLAELIAAAKTVVAPFADGDKLKESPLQRAALKGQVSSLLNKFGM